MVGDAYVFTTKDLEGTSIFKLLTIVQEEEKFSIAVDEEGNRFTVTLVFLNTLMACPLYPVGGRVPYWGDVTEYTDVSKEPRFVREYSSVVGYCPVHQRVFYHRNEQHTDCTFLEDQLWKGWF